LRRICATTSSRVIPRDSREAFKRSLRISSGEIGIFVDFSILISITDTHVPANEKGSP